MDGITPREMARMIRALTIHHNVLGIDIAEYNLLMDSRSFQTVEVVMFLMRDFIAAEAAKKRGITDPLYYAPRLVGDKKLGPPAEPRVRSHLLCGRATGFFRKLTSEASVAARQEHRLVSKAV